MTPGSKTCASSASPSKRCRTDDFVKLQNSTRTWAGMRTTFLLVVSLLVSACFVAPQETVIGTVPSSAGDGGADAGSLAMMGDAGPDGDATCDQSACLPTTTTFSRTAVSRLLRSGDDAVFTLGSMYGAGLSRVELATGATTQLRRAESDPLDPSGELRLQGDYVYLLTTWAGEVFGIPARLRLSDGTFESLTTSQFGSGSPVDRAFDVDATDFVFVAGTSLQRMRLADVPTDVTTTLLDRPGQHVAALRLTPTHVYWVSDTGLHRAERSGANPQQLLAGNFERLELEGGVVWVSNQSQLVRFENGTASTALTGAVRDFTLARGTVFAVVQTGSVARVVDVSGTVHHEETLSSTDPATLALAVTGTRIALGTPSRLVVVSSVAGSSPCGCSAPPVVLPAAAATCERALCGGPVSRSQGFAGGAFSGTDLLGVFRQPNDSMQGLAKVSGALSVQYDLMNPSSHLVADGAELFVFTTYGLSALDATSGTSRSVSDGVYPPWGWGTPPAPMLAVDATHLYAHSAEGIFRVPRAGGAREVLLPFSNFISGLRLDDTSIYVMRNNTLLKLPKSGGAPTVLASGLIGESGFDLGDGHAYFVTVRGLERVRLTGGFKSLVLTTAQLGEEQLSQVHVQGREVVFVVSAPGGADRLVRLDLQTLARENVLTLPTNSTRWGVTISPKGYALGSYEQTRFQLRDCCP
jgi:hypothetical protein